MRESEPSFIQDMQLKAQALDFFFFLIQTLENLLRKKRKRGSFQRIRQICEKHCVDDHTNGKDTERI